MGAAAAAAARPSTDKPALLDLRIEGAAECGGGGSAPQSSSSGSNSAVQRHAARVAPAGSGSASSRERPPLLLLEHGFFRGLPGWGGPGTGGAWEDAELEGSSVAVPALSDALDVRHFDSRCVLFGAGLDVDGIGVKHYSWCKLLGRVFELGIAFRLKNVLAAVVFLCFSPCCRRHVW